VIGCGEISKRYFLHCPIFDILEVVACSSLHMDSARDMAKKYGVPKACTVDDLLADLAYGIQSGRQHRASGELAYHVLDAMLAFEDSAREGKCIELQSRCTPPATLPLGLVEGNLDD
jgi:predicted dehydrogenase